MNTLRTKMDVDGDSVEAKFQAAVNVIQNLPKDGSYQPSNEMKLQFYSYYKQATDGRCNIPKPSFWEVVGKAKWDAWHSLGDMPKSDAMNNYVMLLAKIVETMSYSQQVEEFMDLLGPIYDIIQKEALKTKGGEGDGKLVKDNDKQDQKLVSNIPLNILNTKSQEQPVKQIGVQTNCDNHSSVDEDSDHIYEHSSVRTNSYTERFYSEHSDTDNSSDAEFSDTANGFDGVKPTHNRINSSEDSGCIVLNENTDLGINKLNQLYEDADKQLWAFFPNKVDITTKVMAHDGYQSHLDGLYDCGLPKDSYIGNTVMARGNSRDNKITQHRAVINASTQHGRAQQIERVSQGGSITSLPSIAGSAAGGNGGYGRTNRHNTAEINEQICTVLLRLQRDMESVLTRLTTLEALTMAHHHQTTNMHMIAMAAKPSWSKWWPVRDLSPPTFFFVLLWPVLVQILVKLWMYQRKKKK